MQIEKKTTKKDSEKIIAIYEKYDIPYIPKLIEYFFSGNECTLKFEWIEGKQISAEDVPNAFYTLGKMHMIGKRGNYDNGFETICHGDFHLKNIVIANVQIRFVDVMYMHFGWNYSDFDYVDFYDLYDPVVYPWMIHNKDCLTTYLEAIGQKLTAKEQETLIRNIVIFSLKNNIKNGLIHCIDVSKEEGYLKSIENSPYTQDLPAEGSWEIR